MSSKQRPPYTKEQIADLAQAIGRDRLFSAEYQGKFEIQKPPSTIYVLAGSHRQFDRFCRLRDINPRKAVYVWDSQSLRGKEKETLIRYGTWYEQRNADEIIRIAIALGWTIQDDED